MTSTNLSSCLDRVEQQFHAVAAHVAAGDTSTLAAASQALQTLCVEMLELIGPPERLRHAPPAHVARIRALAHGLQQVRENLARRSAYVNQALGIVMPAPTPSTYGAIHGQSGRAFGGVAAQSGQFKVLAA